MTEKTYFMGIAIIFAFGAVVRGAVTILSNGSIDPQPAVEYRAVCSDLPANAHRNGSGKHDDGTRKEIPQKQTSQNVRGPSPVGEYDAVGTGSDAGCYFICDDGSEREDGFCVKWEFGYTGGPQTFVASENGLYLFEARGARGGHPTKGGKGGYTKGEISLKKGEVIYVYVGQIGTDSIALEAADLTGRWNGGGGSYRNKDGKNKNDTVGHNGGGATDFRLTSGAWNDEVSLRSRIMVAGGGGGSAARNSNNKCGGNGGGLTGGLPCDPDSTDNVTPATAGTQRAGGSGCIDKKLGRNWTATPGIFGGGGRSPGYGGGGGGGYFGGGAGCINSGGGDSVGGAGGSSFISGYTGAIAVVDSGSIVLRCTEEDAATDVTCSHHYSGKIFSGAVMIAGNQSMPDPNGGADTVGNVATGYAKVSLIVKE